MFDAAERGVGVRAVRAFERHAPVLRFGGRLIASDRVTDFTHVLQIGRGLCLGPSGGLDDYVNHSCDPNTRVEIVGSAVYLIARAPIGVGDEITFDYSTCMVDEQAIPSCLCGADVCRGAIEPFADLSDAAAARLVRARLVPAFAREARREAGVTRVGRRV